MATPVNPNPYLAAKDAYLAELAAAGATFRAKGDAETAAYQAFIAAHNERIAQTHQDWLDEQTRAYQKYVATITALAGG